MKIKKSFLALIIIFFIIFKNFIIYADTNYNYDFDFILDNKINIKTNISEDNIIQITGLLPKIDNNKFKNKNFADKINQKIDLIYKQNLKTAISNKSKTLKISYDIKARKNIVSILIYLNQTRKYIETINFNLKTLEFIKLTDILGSNAVAIANKVIKDNTIKSELKYNSDFVGIDNSHDFYLEEDNLVIVFDEYELSPVLKDIQKFYIDINSVVNKILEKKDYYVTKPYNLKMIPVKKICKTFGYRVIWNVTFYSVEFIKDDLNILGYIDRNIYTRNKENPRTLESAMKIYDNKACAPISFFTEYIDLIYSVSDDGTITFSQYIKK